MARLFIMAISLFYSVCATAQSLPSYNEVINRFFHKYSYAESDGFIRFQKKKEGWFVATIDYARPDDVLTSELFWSEKENNYQDLSPYFPLASSDSAERDALQTRFMQITDAAIEEYSFQRNIYYGYKGWDWDVITNMLNRTSATDTMWESCGRAYSNYASGFFMDQMGNHFVNNDSNRRLLKDDEKISKARIDQFKKYEDKAIAAYQQIAQRNPYYITKVGDIVLKLANEYVFAYFDIMLAGDKQTALAYLKACRYEDSVLERARQYLDAVPMNGILITGGDNDTYPLWYLQETQGYRKDVDVLNISLLGMKRYLKILDEQKKGTLFSTPASAYLQKEFELSYYSGSDSTEKSVEAASFIRKLNAMNSQNADKNNPRTNDAYPRQYDNRYVYFSSVALKNNTKKENGMPIRIRLNDYLLMSDFILIDIIRTNLNKRPVLFTFFYEMFNGAVKENGPLFEFTPTAR